MCNNNTRIIPTEEDRKRLNDKLKYQCMNFLFETDVTKGFDN